MEESERQVWIDETEAALGQAMSPVAGVGLAKSGWRVWPCQQATVPFCGSSSGKSARAASSLQCELQESTTGAGARALPGQ